MRDGETIRRRARNALKRYFESRRSPRAMLSLIVLATALAGLGISAALLKTGLSEMWMRYPLALFGAYGVFLALVRVWAGVEKNRVRPEDLDLDAPEDPPDHGFSENRHSWLDWLDVSDFDAGLFALLIAGVVGLLAVVISLIGAAPILIAEVFLDALLAGLLFRRLKIPATEHWLGAAIRKTWLHVVGAAALLALIGFCLDQLAPKSDSIGPALNEIFRPTAPAG